MIETKVVDIESDHSVLLGAGHEHAVKTGMKFVLFERGREVRDPETGESLGHVEIVKGKVRVVHVQQRFCRAETETYTVQQVVDPLTPMKAYAALMGRRSVSVSKHYALKVAEEFARKTTEEPPMLKIGDLARQILE